MKRYKWMGRWLTIIIMLIALFVAALPVALVSNPVLAEDVSGAQWNKTFGGASGDYGYSVQQTSDGGYIVAGCTKSYGAGGYDVWLIKTNADGNEEWNKTFGESNNDYGYSVQQTSDGGYIIVGRTMSYGAVGYDVLLIKTDAGGNTSGGAGWVKTFGGSDNDYGYSVQQTSDDGYIIVGRTGQYGFVDYDVLLIKTDASGNTSGGAGWIKTFGGSDDDGGNSVQQTSDGGYIVVGETKSYGSGDNDVWLIKTYANGNEEWNKTFGGSADDGGNSVQQTSDGGYIITGRTGSHGSGGLDVWLIKTNTSGNESWSRTFGGSASDCGNSVRQTPDEGYIIAGYTSSYGAGGLDVLLIKTDVSGKELWKNTFGGSADFDVGWWVQRVSDGRYIIVGETESYGAGNSDIWLIKASNPPNQPINISPPAGATGVGLTPTLLSSNFSDPDSGDTHAASQWQVTTISGMYFSPIYDSGRKPLFYSQIMVPSGKLKGGTTYYWHVRYQDNSGTWSSYSDETSFTTTTTSRLSDRCFIATAAYGTPMAEEIQVLRDFRDQYLLTNPMGKAFVYIYYQTSPPIADYIAEHPVLRQAVRTGLEPLIAMSNVAVNITSVQKIAIVGSVVLLSSLLIVWFRRRDVKARRNVS